MPKDLIQTTPPKVSRNPAEPTFFPAARMAVDAIATKPELIFDLVTTGVNTLSSVEMQAFFKDKPAPQIEIEVLSNSGWQLRARTDENGKVALILPWAATYILMMKKLSVDMFLESGTQLEIRRPSLYMTTITFHRSEGLTRSIPMKSPCQHE